MLASRLDMLIISWVRLSMRLAITKLIVNKRLSRRQNPLNNNSNSFILAYTYSFIFIIAAQQYASAFHTLAAAINLRKDSAECYMLLGSKLPLSSYIVKSMHTHKRLHLTFRKFAPTYVRWLVVYSHIILVRKWFKFSAHTSTSERALLLQGLWGMTFCRCRNYQFGQQQPQRLKRIFHTHIHIHTYT